MTKCKILIKKNRGGNMDKLKTNLAIFVSIAVWIILPLFVLGQEVESQYEKLTREGKSVYGTYCVGCHGVKGNGYGQAAKFLYPKPRDFTKGIFKFRTTPSGSLPTDEDMYKTITRGLFGTAMPEFSLLPERQRLAVVAYIKTFSKLWQRRKPKSPIYIPEPPEWLGNSDSVKRGKEVYILVGCHNCHGETGKGDGSSAATLKPDVWGHPQKPFNFTRGRLKGGPGIKDIYKTFMTGLNGTAMPSYADFFENPPSESPLEKDDIWHLISYILSLRVSETNLAQK